MPYMDRSMFFSELQQNPQLLTRLLTLVNGEVGRSAPEWLRTMYLETVFNRAVARGQTIQQVTRSRSEAGNKGYYPDDTLRNGAPRSTDEQTRFNERILKPVLSGSDVSTQRVGFASTGNASNDRTMFADRQIAKGEYSKYKWMPLGNGAREVFVQHTRGDDIAKLEATRKGEPPRPPGDIPGGGDVFTSGAAPMDPLTGMRTPGNIDLSNRPVVTNPDGTISTLRSASVGLDGKEVLLPTMTPEGKSVSVPEAVENYKTTGDMLGTFFAPEAATNFARTMHTAQDDKYAPIPASSPNAKPQITIPPKPGTGYKPVGTPGSRDDVPIDAGQTLGERMIKAMGPRGFGASTYIDPDTGHQILNPGGSGEEAMGITRDLGRPRVMAPAPQPRTGPQSPPAQRPATAPPAGPVPDILAPLTGGTDERRKPVYDPNVFDVKQVAQRGGPGMTGLSGGIVRAPEEAGLLAAPSPQVDTLQPPQSPDKFQSTQNGGTSLPPYQPTTVGEQMLGLSPFNTSQARPLNFAPSPRSMQAGLAPFSVPPQQSAFPSTTLLPFDQWPPVGFDFAGPFNFNAWG